MKLKTVSKYFLCTLLVVMLFSCGLKQNSRKEEYEKNTEIIKIRNCEYVLWHNGYGSDMEHYEGCKNAEHCY